MSSSNGVDSGVVVSYQGVEGAYSHLACKNAFKDSRVIACDSFTEAMECAKNGRSDFAMIPIQNSTAGRVEDIYRLIPKLSLHIVGEHKERVKHCLLGIEGSSIDDIEDVYSHPQALAQCHINITKLNLNACAKFDTAGSAKYIKELNNPKCGAIASSLSSKLYNLDILDDNFADFSDNATKFIILCKEYKVPEYVIGRNYTVSLFFELRNIPSSLYKALGGFATNGINMTKIESYSSPGTFENSQFHVDLSSHIDNESFRLAFEELKFFTKEVKILGVYSKDRNSLY